jgi:hypothetical protein
MTLGCEQAPLPPIAPPPLDPETVAAAAVRDGDADGNGTIEKSEFDRLPALAGAIGDFDQDGNGSVSAA